jgi:transposase-like protein
MIYREKFKEEIVKRYATGETVSCLSQSTGVSKSTIYEWINLSNGIFSITNMQKTINEQNKKNSSS